MTSGGFMIVVRNNSFIDSKQHPLPSNYFKDLKHQKYIVKYNTPSKSEIKQFVFLVAT